MYDSQEISKVSQNLSFVFLLKENIVLVIHPMFHVYVLHLVVVIYVILYLVDAVIYVIIIPADAMFIALQ